MLRNKKGVSLITLLITIIVVIILAVIVMRGTGGTIEQANYSSYMDDLGKVKEAVKTKATEVKGEYLIEGRTVSMEEIYHYVAKGGKTGDDFVGKVNVPDYTIIDREKADIGIEIPTRNIESGTARNVQIQYIVTKKGEVFAWPPYEYEDKLYITENVIVAGKLDKDMQIEDESFTLDLDATLGTVLPTEGQGGDDEGGEGGSATPNPELAEIDVGEYVIYNSDKGDIECRVWEKNANGDIVIMPTNPVGSLTLGGEGESVYGPEKMAVAATSYLNGKETIQNYCKEYTSNALGVTKGNIESFTRERACEMASGVMIETKTKYACYPFGVNVSGVTTEADGLAGYTKTNLDLSNEATGLETHRIYTYDYAKNIAIDERGNMYAYPTETDPVFITSTWIETDLSKITPEIMLYMEMIGSYVGWSASSMVNYVEGNGMVTHFLNTFGEEIKEGHDGSSDIMHSDGYSFSGTFGVRPLITLSSSLNLDNSVLGMDGTSSNPWIFTK